jgi:hypothetical protein
MRIIIQDGYIYINKNRNRKSHAYLASKSIRIKDPVLSIAKEGIQVGYLIHSEEDIGSIVNKLLELHKESLPV